jgi:hypothetical protein
MNPSLSPLSSRTLILPGSRRPPSLAAARERWQLAPLPSDVLLKRTLLIRSSLLLVLMWGFLITASTPHLSTLVRRFRSRIHTPRSNFRFTGIPGPYSLPPVDSSKPYPTAYYVITKGLYIGIFCHWQVFYLTFLSHRVSEMCIQG